MCEIERERERERECTSVWQQYTLLCGIQAVRRLGGVKSQSASERWKKKQKKEEEPSKVYTKCFKLRWTALLSLLSMCCYRRSQQERISSCWRDWQDWQTNWSPLETTVSYLFCVAGLWRQSGGVSHDHVFVLDCVAAANSCLWGHFWKDQVQSRERGESQGYVTPYIDIDYRATYVYYVSSSIIYGYTPQAHFKVLILAHQAPPPRFTPSICFIHAFYPSVEYQKSDPGFFPTHE